MSRAPDCFEVDPAAMIPFEKARELLRERVRPVVGTTTLALDDALGAVLAKDVPSEVDVPGFANAAVDGWAFKHPGEARKSGFEMALQPGRAAAGRPFEGAVQPGHALRALTGAPMPDGADTVALQEDSSALEGRVALPGVEPGANVRPAGEDLARGALAVAAGTVLDARHLGLLALAGRADVPACEPLRVALFSTGDELAEPGQPLPPGGVYDANRRLLKALLANTPVQVTDLGILPDDGPAVEAALAKAASNHHAVITSGGASAGDEDHAVRAAGKLGSLHFWRVAIKPGRPLAFGSIEGAVFVGLPGNPVAAAVCFLTLARPVLLRLAGAAWPGLKPLPIRAGFAMRKKPGRTEMVRVKLEHVADGSAVARKVAKQGSGVLTSLTEADGLALLEHDRGDVREGEAVPYLPLLGAGL